jgi:hypothetical protein
MKPAVVELRPFSRPWWAAWCADAKAGRPVGFMTTQALRGKGRVVRLADRPCSVAIHLLVPVEVAGEDFAAWSAHFARFGIVIPRPRHCPVVWLPAQRPEELAA